MLLVASTNGLVGFPAAIEILESGGSALDAVEAAVRVVEDNPDDHTVGYGGYPNLRGEVELDASIMDGSTRRTGAVAALKGYRHPISVARAVMERLPHVLLAGDGAAALAAELGFETEDLLTPETTTLWRKGLEGMGELAAAGAWMVDVARRLTSDPERVPPADAGTVNVLAIDTNGRVASAVSTSGFAFKYPGRVGDSPIVGAGNYCDSRFGAAACTGSGELAIRAGSARMVVADLERGTALADACRSAMEDLFTLGVPSERLIMNLVAIDASGRHCGVTTQPDRTYVAWEGAGEPQTLPRTSVSPR